MIAGRASAVLAHGLLDRLLALHGPRDRLPGPGASVTSAACPTYRQRIGHACL